MNENKNFQKTNIDEEIGLDATNQSEKIQSPEDEIRSLKERIEADRNAIMQIQFEAKQHKQEELDLHETYIWRTGLKIEKLLQKTGIAFIRSLLEISDYKRMGLMVTLSKGLNEGIHRENVSHNKKRRISLCKEKFLRYKRERERCVPCKISDFDVPKEKGLISVILPVYNGEKVVAESIKSVISQTYSKFELIIVNDGSTDKTLEIIEDFAKKDNRIKVINQENKKLPTALSVGFREARGEFFTWTSADNIMLPHCLSVMVKDLQAKPDTAMVYGNMRLIDARGRIKRGHFWFEKPFLSGNVCLPTDTKALNTYANNTIGAAFMYRAEAAQILGDYSKYKTNLEDYDYWMRMNSLFKIDHTDEEKPLYLYRIHNDSLTSHDRELGITKNRYKLMVLDDFRRDFYMSSLVWIVESEDEADPTYKDFVKAAEAAGHMLLTREEALSCSASEEYSCFCYVYFGKHPHPEKIREMKGFSGTVLVCENADCEYADDFDICITRDSKAQLKKLDDYRGWFFADSAKAIFDLAETKIKNNILYSLERVIDDPPAYEKKISIIICTYLRGEKLVDAIWSVIRQSLSKKNMKLLLWTTPHTPQASVAT